MSTAITFDYVTKQYRIGAGRSSLRETIYELPNRLLRKVDRKDDDQYFFALKDVSFEINKGEAFGIIGPNGAGKTTTLKLLSNITKPTAGRIEVEGRMSALIELGAGFHPDLTGRENIFLNGTILGLSRKEIAARFDDIVAFAEMEKFIDMPVKRYSSGMYARLGFAVAAHVDPEVLLVDEVLSVGDEAFQLKCRDFIHSFVNSGRTSVFVSHNLYAVEQLCDRVMWLDSGEIVDLGKPSKILRAYMDETDRRMTSSMKQQAGYEGDRLRIASINVKNANGSEMDTFKTGDDIVITLNYESNREIEQPHFIVWISEARNNMPVFAANMILDNYEMPSIKGQGSLTCHFKNVPIMPRAYSIWVEVYGKDRSQILYKWRVVGGFRVLDSGGIASPNGNEEKGQVRFRRAHGILQVPYEWKS
jgi:lipopolysaccharide transport system ATP-binding protein